MKNYEIKDHAPSILPDGEWKLVWSDEFDGDELDRTKWDFRLNFWGKPFAAYTDNGIIVKDGCVELHRTERDGCYVSPQLQTGSNSFDIPVGETENPWGQESIWKLGGLSPAKFEHRFGYYECRCKFQREPDVMWSAFWLQSPSIGTRYDPTWCGIESDIMECFATNRASSGNIWGGYGKQFKEDGRVIYDVEPTEDGFHRFGMLWTEKEYVFYCDGKETSRCNKAVSQVPEFILLTTEIRGYRINSPLKVGEYYDDSATIKTGAIKRRQEGFSDDAFIVDYVRVFDEVK